MGSLFGTDGVRGVAGVDLSAELATAVAAAAAAVLAGHQPRSLVVVGRDPRPSGLWLQDAVLAGLTGAGCDVALLGVIPTPAVARAVADGVPGLAGTPDFGIVISASHNPVEDNGIKLFGAGGIKLDEATEAEIETLAVRPSPRPDATARRVVEGRVVADLSGDSDWYVEALLATVPDRLAGLRLVVDCANGAASAVAAAVYSRAGADVAAINTERSGERINEDCGATHLEALQAAVVSSGADLGIAHDGDADRCLAVTSTGDVIDGDGILAVLALDLHRRGQLTGGAVAATVMSNLGLVRALRPYGIEVVTTAVGDRHVCERMRADGLSLGGEQSGHIVLLDRATTGDGLLTGLALLSAVALSGRSLGELAAVIEPMPQVLVNVRVADRDAAITGAADLVAAATHELGAEGRVLVRASGTEPLVRVMVEAVTEQVARDWAQRIAAAMS
jgi:phosphoglucosamine mutase